MQRLLAELERALNVQQISLIYRQQQGYRQALLLMDLWIRQCSSSKLSQVTGYIGKQEIPIPKSASYRIHLWRQFQLPNRKSHDYFTDCFITWTSAVGSRC